jgi:predicted glycosyltransferase
MKIIFYCQHVLGIGHFFRSLEICRTLDEHDLILVTGGPKPDVELAKHIREVRLPGLMMNPDFSELFIFEKNSSIEKVRSDRKKMLVELLELEKPDLFIVELYPFGRKAFKFELDPALEQVKKNHRNQCRSVCSLRDILVEKKDPETYEKKVIQVLNTSFDALIIHSDPDLFPLDESFSRIKEIRIPIVYTGFVTPVAADDAKWIIRKQLEIGSEKKLVIVSAGGGKVGFSLLEASLEAAHLLIDDVDLHMEVFSGPFMSHEEFTKLKRLETKDFAVNRFTPNFISYLTAADLSVSMAGYNTCMNILVSKTPAIVWPFPQNREQRLRAERLAQKAPFKVLTDNDLTPDRLAFFIREGLLHKEAAPDMININLQGSTNTAKWIKNLINS